MVLKENNLKTLELPHFLSLGLIALVILATQFYTQTKLIQFSKQSQLANAGQLQTKDRNIAKEIGRIELIDTSLSLFAILVVALCIFRPQELKLRKAFTELENEKNSLIKKKEAAELSDKIKNEFLTAISYEIRTPVNGMLGMTSLLLDTNLSEEQRDYVLLLNKSTDSVLNIINDIADLSKIETGQLSLDQSYFDFRAIVEDIADLASVKAEEKDVELVVSYELGLPRYFIGDPYRIRQILNNVVTKSVELARKGAVLINVGFEQKSDYKTNLKLDVEANNTNIVLNKLTQAFDKFVQLDEDSSDEQGKGDGLSLAITRQLVELMKGRISIASESGQTVKFTLNIPLILDRDAPNIIHNRKMNLSENRILVATDNKLNGKILQKHLNNFGIDNSLKASDEESLQELREGIKEGDPYCIVLVDLQMIHLDTEIFISKLKSDPDLRNLKIIFMTSLGNRREAKNLIEQQAPDATLLIKPIKPILLMEALTTQLESKGKEASAATKQSEPKGVRVLVVEDNLVNQKVAVCMLEKLGCRVDAASNGKRALELLKAYPYEIIFMDCQMPEMDGYQATIEIRRLYDSERHISIIAMTANAMQGDREKCFQVGMDGYISKPIKLDDLKDALKYCVSKSDLPVIEFPCLEPDVLENLRNLRDEKFLEEIFQTFLRNTSDILVTVSKAIYEENIGNLKAAAQSLKGASVDIGAKRIAEICQSLEALTDLTPTNKTAALIAATQLNREFRRVKGEIEAQMGV